MGSNYLVLIRRRRGRLTLRVLLAVLLVGTFATAPTAAQAVGGDITGTVTDASTGRPLANVLVEAVYPNQPDPGDFLSYANTGADGRYDIQRLGTNNWKIRFDSNLGNNFDYLEQFYNNKSFASADLVPSAPGSTTSNINAALVPTGRISGTVTDATTHAGIGNVTIHLYHNGAVQYGTQTAADGTYTVLGQPTASASYQVEFVPPSGSGYVSQFYNKKATLASADPVTITAGSTTPGIDAVLGGHEAISGKILDPKGNPVPGIQVNVTGADSDANPVSVQTTTDASGRYAAVLAKPGNYTASPQRPGQPPVGSFSAGDCQGTATPGACQISLGAGETKTADFTYEPGVTLTGNVLANEPWPEGGGTRPLANVMVHVTGQETAGRAIDMTVSTNRLGRYSLTVNPGDYTISPTGDPPAAQFGIVELGFGLPFIPATNIVPIDPGGTYRTMGCTGAKQNSDCQINAGLNPVETADFAYGHPRRLTVSLDPPTVRGDGFGQSHLTVGLTDTHGAPVDGARTHEEVLSGLGPYGDLLCSVRPLVPGGLLTQPEGGLYREHIEDGNAPAVAVPDAAGRSESLVFAGSAPQGFDYHHSSGEDFSYRAAPVGTTFGAGGFPLAPLAPPAVAFTTPGSAKLAVTSQSGAPIGDVAAELRRLALSVGGPSGLGGNGSLSDDEVQQHVVDWLVALKAAGYLAGIDFGPIGTTPDKGDHPGVFFFRHDDTSAYDAVHSPAGDLVHPVLGTGQARALLGALRPTGALPSFAEWGQEQKVTFFLKGLQSELARHNVDAGDQTYFGYPYPPPPTIPGARRFYDCLGDTVPLPERERIVVHSPVHLLITGPHGRALGFTAHGTLRRSLAGLFVVPRHGPQLYEVNPGRETVSLSATGAGQANLVIYPPSRILATPRLFSFPVRPGQTGTLLLSPTGPAGSLRFAGHRYRASAGIRLRLSGWPRKFPRHPTMLHLRVQDQFGEPVPGVAIRVTGAGLRVETLSDSRGLATVSVHPVRRGVKITLTAPTYRTLTKVIRG